MVGPTSNTGRVLSDSALRGAERVLAQSPRLVSSPVAGFAEASALVAEGAPPLSGQITERDFFQALGGAIVDRLGLMGQGDERRPRVEAAIGEVASSIFKILSDNASWQATLDRLIGPVQDRSPAGVQAAIDRLADILDPAAFLDLARRVGALQALPESERDFVGFDEMDAGRISELIKLIGAVIPPSIWQQVVGSAAYKAAEEIQQSVPANSVSSSIADGTRVHSAVQVHYGIKNSGLLLMERVMFGPKGNRIGRLGDLVKDANAGTLIKAAFQAFISMGANQFPGYVKPDILDLATRELYEIKPRSQAVLGVAQMQMYVFWWSLVVQNTGLLPIVPGVTYVPPRVFPVTKGKVAVIQRDQRVPGLIFYDLYECNNCKKLQEQIEALPSLSPEAIATLVVISATAAVAIGILIGAGVPAAGPAAGGFIPIFAQLMQQAVQQTGGFALP